MPIEPHLYEWVSHLLRWVHVITAIAWIGSSFYFIHLDLSLRRREGLPAGVGGEAWQVHGGGFYRIQKYLIAPPELPKELTWFKWESYSTWLTGFFLLVWIYYLQADLFMVDPAVMALAPWQAAALGLAGLLVGWLVYEGLCRSPLGQHDLVLSVVLFGFIMAAAWGFGLFLHPRAAFLHTGAMIATWMSASVFFVIIPNQKKVVADLLAGRSPDPRLGKEAKLRSTHNNYLTLPVVFLMLANHYPLAWGSRWSWAIVGLIVIAGGVVRHFYNSRHAGLGSPHWTWAVAAAAIFLAVLLSTAGRPAIDAPAPAGASGAALFHEAVVTIQSRCSMCHAAEPAWAGLVVAPKGVRLESADDVARHAHEIDVQTVLTRAMPPGNITGMTDEERALLAAWLAERRR